MKLTTDEANAIWDVLVEHAGATEHGREDFVFHQTDMRTDEYRFMGMLGFGGKFWNYNGRWYVTAYPETVKFGTGLQQAIDATNAALAALDD